MDHPSALVQVEGAEGAEAASGSYVRVAQVDPGYFESLRKPILAGRGFDGTDLVADPRPVIANSRFAETLLQGRDPVGHRVRFVGSGDDSDPRWLEIVGVVGDLGMNIVSSSGSPGLYLPFAPGEIHPLRLGIELGEDPAGFVPRAREIVAQVDPSAIIRRAVPLDQVYQGDWYLTLAVAGGMVLLAAILVALATSGIYAIMSFSISERTREIGIRRALGAGGASVALTVLRRSLLQIAAGALLGTPVALLILLKVPGQAGQAGSAGGTVAVAVGVGLVIVLSVALLGCLAPTRRILAIEPCDALRVEG
jgi:hypothetical protein